MVICTLAGREFGRRSLAAEPERTNSGFGVTSGAVFGLLGLLIAFTFSGAASQFDMRRQLIVQEVNAISTAHARLDLLPSQSRLELSNILRDYVAAQLAAYRMLASVEAARLEFARVKLLQDEIWKKTVAACSQSDGKPICLLLLPALNGMFDITTARTVALHTHAPLVIFGLLIAVALASALLVGDAMAESRASSWIHAIIFVLVLVVTIYVIIDLENPRAGVIRIQAVENLLVDLLGSVK